MFTILFTAMLPAYPVVGMLIGFMLDVLVYFVPSIVAWNKRHANTTGIIILNVLLGWTLIGWVGALLWSTYNKPTTA